MTEKSEPACPKGFTIGIFLPKEASQEHIERVMDCVSQMVFDVILEDRGNWDPFIVGHAGDVFQIDSRRGNESCPHIYLSTSCFHGIHTYCQNETGLLGKKIPGVCKFCEAPCICACHREKREGEAVDG